jgi:hypothetical protein
MAEMPDFNVRDVLRESKTTFWIHVRAVRDWRFRLGWCLVRWGARLMGMACRLDETH